MAEYTFGPFLLNTETSRLTREGQTLRLRPRAFQLLQVLLEHAGTVMDREKLLATVWGRTHVSPHTVDVTVADIRKQLGEYSHWLVGRAKLGYGLELPRADALVRQGWHLWSHRTRAGCEQAINCFARVIAETPSDFRAFEGLSASYLALAVFGIRSPLELYPLFVDAYDRAVSLSGPTPELRCHRAFGRFVFESEVCESEAELRSALDDKPTLACAYVRLGLLYGSLRRFDAALDLFDRGSQFDPLLPTLAASEIMVRCWQRDFDGAVRAGAQAVSLHPYLHVIRANYATALQLADRPEEALAQYRTAAAVSPDVPWLAALEGACQAALGRLKPARAALGRLEAARRSQYVDAYFVAKLRLALGQEREALAELERAHDDNSAWMYSLDVDPSFDALRGDRAFRRLLRLRARRRPARARRGGESRSRLTQTRRHA
jgi:tetratricopeptide (TPR) repeat protein